MSHVVTVDIEIKDIDCLRKACKAIGLEFRENQKTYKWYGRSVGDYPIPNGFSVSDLGKCDHAIGIPNNNSAYEIGVVKRDNKYTLLWDFWSGGYGLQGVVGDKCGNLVQAYTKEVAVKKARNMGYIVKETKNKNGDVVLTLSK